ncbi:unnamed protein product [Eruca vesicaria subsp. sativa]|uniref:Replication protein A 70 kDa DNA-binding subunit B/D first OB fold domain-containing protein n=1 Tax=Eruca vesicaria subsp. sativa TaxID=29727 RepID=A0ABC8M8K6_ERUVS|nr:unnamed protein product [Eruca vesicaria subsp. sativa]
MVNFISLSELNTKIQFPAIRVKIVRKWSTKIGRDHHSTMLLGDSKVVTIEGSLTYALSLPNEIELKECDWVEILNFEIRRVFSFIEPQSTSTQSSSTKRVCLER